MNNSQIKCTFSTGLFCMVAGLFYIVQTNAGSPPVSKNNIVHPCGIILPKATGYVNDFTHLFTTQQTHTLDSIIGLQEQQTTNQIAIITIDTSMLGKCTVDEYTLAIANEWGVGVKGKNNGVLIGIAPGLRKMRIQNGDGIEKILSNERTQIIIDSFFIPEFKNGNYFQGTMNGLAELIKSIK